MYLNEVDDPNAIPHADLLLLLGGLQAVREAGGDVADVHLALVHHGRARRRPHGLGVSVVLTGLGDLGPDSMETFLA